MKVKRLLRNCRLPLKIPPHRRIRHGLQKVDRRNAMRNKGPLKMSRVEWDGCYGGSTMPLRLPIGANGSSGFPRSEVDEGAVGIALSH